MRSCSSFLRNIINFIACVSVWVCVYACTRARERDRERQRRGKRKRQLLFFKDSKDCDWCWGNLHVRINTFEKISLYAVDLIMGFDQSLTPFQGIWSCWSLFISVLHWCMLLILNYIEVLRVKMLTYSLSLGRYFLITNTILWTRFAYHVDTKLFIGHVSK